MEKDLLELEPKSVVWSIEEKDGRATLVRGYLGRLADRDVVFAGPYGYARVVLFDHHWHKDPNGALTEYTASMITRTLSKMDYAMNQALSGAPCVPLPTVPTVR